MKRLVRLFSLLLALLVPSQSFAGWTQIALAAGYDAVSGTTNNTSTSLNVAVGDLLIAHTGWQGAVSGDVVTVDQSDGTDTFTTPAAAKGVQASDIGTALSYLIVGGADATFTPRFTLSAAGTRRGIAVYQFRPDASETVSADGANVGLGLGTALATGTITTTGTDEVVVGGGGHDNGSLLTVEQIGGVNADGSSDYDADGFYGIWYRILTATMTNGTADATAAASDNWAISVHAFKSEAAGGGAETFGFRRRVPQ